MRLKVITGLLLTLFLIGMLTLAFNIQPVKAEPGTIYIRANGNIDPPTANITSVDKITYTFTDNNYEGIVVERDNIVVDGAGYTVQGIEAPESIGINLTVGSNVTIKNTEIKAFTYGIFLWDSSSNSIFGNNITANNGVGIVLIETLNNSIVGNSITNNHEGIYLLGSSYNSIVGNNITANINDGIGLEYSSNNSISVNNITNNSYGIWLRNSSDNFVYYNNFINNTQQAGIYTSGYTNFWDGNYWSDYGEKYPDAKEIDGSGIWDTPYVIDENNKDNYPLVNVIPEFPTWTSILLILIVLTFAIAIHKRRLLKTPIH